MTSGLTNFHPISTHSNSTSSEHSPEVRLKRKRSREKENKDVEATDTKCGQVRSVQFHKEVKSMEFHTQLYDTESPVFMRLSSTQSTTSSSSQVDDQKDENIIQPLKRTKAIRPNRATQKSELATISIAQIAHSGQTLIKKRRTYPKPVTVTTTKKTQWKDPFKTTKEDLERILYGIFIEQRPKNNFSQPDTQTKKNVCSVIHSLIKQIVEYLENSEIRESFLNSDKENFENMLKNFINNYTQEDDLDATTLRQVYLGHPKYERPKNIDETTTYTYKTIRDEEREQLLASIPTFLSNEEVLEKLNALCQQFQASSST